MTGQMFSRGEIIAEDLIQMPVVELRLDILPERFELAVIADETSFIKGFGLQLHFDHIIVAMKPSAAMPERKLRDQVRRREWELLCNTIHQARSRLVAPAVTSCQKCGSS